MNRLSIATGALRSRPTSLVLVCLLWFSALFAGCGSSSGDFVFTGNTNNAPGSLTFQFFKAQAVAVPQATTSITFDFFDASNALLASQTEPYASSITVVPPVATASVRVTPRDGNGFPLLQLSGAATRPADGVNVIVNLTSFTATDVTFDQLVVTPDPVVLQLGTQNGGSQALTLAAVFSNGENVVFPAALLSQAVFTPDNSGVYTVNAAGVVTGVLPGSGLLDVSFTDGEGTQRSDTVTVNVSSGILPFVVTPDTLNVPLGGTSAAVTCTFNGQAVANNLVVFSIVGNTAGFTANANGTVSVDASVLAGTTATLQASYSVNNEVFVDTVSVIAEEAEIVGRVFSTPTADLTLPYDIRFQLVVTEEFDNGGSVVVTDPVAAGYSFAVNNTNATVSTTPAGLLDTSNNQGTATVDLIFDGQAVDSFVLTVDPTVMVTAINVDPDSLELTPGSTATYTVTADFQGGPQGLDVTSSPALTNNANGTTDASFLNGTATGGSFLGTTVYTFTLGAATDTIEVVSALGFIESLAITVGGQESGFIPFGLDGVVEVVATFTDGRTQKLRSDQFTLSFADSDDGIFVIAGNVLEPAAAPVGGVPQSFEVTPTDADYPISATVTPDTTFEATYVSAGGASTATAAFRHYPNLNVLFTARRLNGTQDAPNRVPRALNVMFTNPQVTDFRVAASNLSNPTGSGFLTIQSDSDGYPVLISSVTLLNLGNYGTSTFEIRDGNGDLVKAAPFAAVRVLNRTIIGNSGTSAGQRFLPSVQSIGVGASETFQVEIDARPAAASANVETFVLTEEFRFVPDDLGVARAEVVGGALQVTGLSTSGAASQQAVIEVVNLAGDVIPGSLGVTIIE